MSTVSMCFRAFCEHGRVLAVTVDDTLTTQHCLKDLREFKKWASRIDSITCEEFRNNVEGLWDCEECKAARRLRRAASRRKAGLL